MINSEEKMVVGLFETLDDAENAFAALKEAGFSDEAISVLASEDSIRSKVEGEMASEAVTDMAVGVAGGAAAGSLAGLLSGAVATTLIPGIGPVLATGWIMASIGGAAIGAVAGGMSKAIDGRNDDRGLAKDDLEIYMQGITAGQIMIAVETDRQKFAQASQIMHLNNAVEIESKKDS